MAIQFGSGKYFQDTLNGNVFIGSTAVGGVALALVTATGATFGVWNPAGSGRTVYPISCQIGYVSGAIAASNFAYGFQSGAGSAIGTAAPVTAVTLGTPNNAIIGAGNASAVKFFPATATLTAGCTFLKTMGVSNLVAAAGTFAQATEYFDGTLAIPPGTILVVGTVGAASFTGNITMVWEEI